VISTRSNQDRDTSEKATESQKMVHPPTPQGINRVTLESRVNSQYRHVSLASFLS
jgi:hypothetical protein